MTRYLSLLLLTLALLAAACGGDASREQAETQDERQDAAADTTNASAPDSLQAGKSGGKTAARGALAKFKYSWSDSEDIPPIVIIIDDFGNDGGQLLQDFADLPSEVVFAVLPDLPYTAKAGEIAASHGHEVLIHTPMQAVTKTAATGKKYISASQTAEEIVATLDAFHRQIPMATGANNHTGSSVTADRDAMTAVLDHLHSLGLFFVDSATTGVSVVPALARSKGYPAMKRDIFLDVPDLTDATLAAKISSLGKYKGRVEPIIVITHCHNRGKLEGLQKFIAQIQAMGLKLGTLQQAKRLAA